MAAATEGDPEIRWFLMLTALAIVVGALVIVFGPGPVADTTCDLCVRRCAPFAVTSCDPRRAMGDGHPMPPDCTCDVSRRADAR